jgi:hypothetical protein
MKSLQRKNIENPRLTMQENDVYIPRVIRKAREEGMSFSEAQHLYGKEIMGKYLNELKGGK